MATSLNYPVTDFLIGSPNTVRLEHKTVTPLQSGTLERGSVLAGSNGVFSQVSAQTVDNAEVILAEDVPEGSSNVTAPVYVSGDFIVQGLKLATGVTLSEAGKKSLKDAGIYLTNGIEA